MKKYILILIAVMFTSLAGYSFDKYTINRSELPEKAQQFLTEHFPKAKVGMIKVDKHLLKKTDYDVKLVNGTKIEFSNSGKWTSVDCKNS
ncbi:MAG: PepSY-like domain-containing protein, partial [Muribaculaceae bacterium]|nr:PepSY-like domain-containing protein [Muribaculaceae bacterium]